MKLASHDIIRRPVITEKSMAVMAENKYAFAAHMATNKVQIKRAVEEVFNIEVADVKAMRFEGKTKKAEVRTGRGADFKKAVITLAEGNGIEFFERIR